MEVDVLSTFHSLSLGEEINAPLLVTEEIEELVGL